MKQDPSGDAEADREELAVLLSALLAWQAYGVIQALIEYEAASGAGVALAAEELAEAAFDFEAEMAKMASAIRPYLNRSAGRAITAMTRDYGLGADVTIDADFIRDLLQAQESRFARDVTTTSVRNIRDQLAQGIAAGEGHYQLRDRILTYYEKQHSWRAGLAAQYECGTAYEAVREALAMGQGMTHKRWMTMRDPNVCVYCAGNERAGAIPIDQPFPSGDTRPLQHPGCRCWLTYTAEPSDGERRTT